MDDTKKYIQHRLIVAGMVREDLFSEAAFAAWVGLLVTALNMLPMGQFDGGHVARSVLGARAHQIISYAGIALLALIGWWTMAVLAIFFSAARHPGPLDDVSKLTTRRKIGAIVLVAIFILSVVPL